MPFLVCLDEHETGLVTSRTLRASDIKGLATQEKADWKTVLIDEKSNKLVVPNGTIGSRWEDRKDGEPGKWNLETKDNTNGSEIWPIKTLLNSHDEVVDVGFPYFANKQHDQEIFQHTEHTDVIMHKVPVRKIKTKDGDKYVATVFDLMMASYGVDRGLGDDNCAKDYADDKPYTPGWQEQITGVDKETVIRIAREFGDNADKTRGRSMIILGAAINHWYNMDMNYRGIINMLMMCGCVGKSGGGWAHYVGQANLRPQTGG
jgi:nitrate reductase alpha subunit